MDKKNKVIVCILVFFSIFLNSCETPEYGPEIDLLICEDNQACNYNSLCSNKKNCCLYPEDMEDGSCETQMDFFISLGSACSLPENNLYLNDEGDGFWEIWYSSTEDIAGFQFELQDATLISANSGDSEDYGLSVSSSENVVLGFSLESYVIPAGCGNLVNLEIDNYLDQFEIINPIFSNDEGNAINFEFYLDQIFGCIDESACNYNPDATHDDDGCEYPEENYGCDGNCLYVEDCSGECDNDLDNDHNCGCLDESANNYNESSTYDLGCEYSINIGQSGGNYSFENASLIISENALNETINISINNLNSEFENTFLNNTEYLLISSIYSFIPTNQSFNNNFTLSIGYPFQQNNLTFLEFENNSWSKLSNGQFNENFGEINLSKFGIYTISQITNYNSQEECIINGVCEGSENYQNCPLDCATCSGNCGNLGFSVDGAIEEECWINNECVCYCDVECVDYDDCCSDIDSFGDEGLDDELYNQDLDDNDYSNWYNIVNQTEYDLYCNGEVCNEGELICSEDILHECINQELTYIAQCENGCIDGVCTSEDASCSGLCEGGYPEGCQGDSCECFCDILCIENGDCCDDFYEVCTLGCTDSSSTNYDSSSNIEDGSCEYGSQTNSNDGSNDQESSGDTSTNEPQEEQEELSFNIDVGIDQSVEGFAPGEYITSNILVESSGEYESEILISCSLVDPNLNDTNEYTSFEEIVNLIDEVSIVRDIQIPEDIPFGQYTIECSLNYYDSEYSDSSDFISISSGFRRQMPSIEVSLIFGLTILLIMSILLIFILLLKLFKNKKVKNKIKKRSKRKK